MDEDSNCVRCIIQDLGLLLFVHPDEGDTWRTQIIISTSQDIAFNEFRLNRKGRIRISVPSQDTSLKDSARTLHTYHIHSQDPWETGLEEYRIKESLLVNCSCINTTLESLLTNQKTLGKRSPLELKLDLTDEKGLDNFTQQLGDCFSKTGWENHRWLTAGSTYLLAYAILIVDNLPAFHQKMIKEKYERDSQHGTSYFPLSEGVSIIQLLKPFENFKIPYFRYSDSHPILLFAIESKQIFDWLDNRRISSFESETFRAAIKQRDYTLYINTLRLIERLLLILDSRCTDILESIPEGEQQQISSSEEQLQELIKLEKNLTFYRSSYIIAKEFMEQEDEIEVESEYQEPDLNKLKIHQLLVHLDERLQLLDQSLQTRLTLENLVVARLREKQQVKTEKAFNKLALYFATFFIFEVLASFFSWLLTPGDPIALISWIILLISPFMLIYLALREFSEDLGKD
jgi:hypothetical protein